MGIAAGLESDEEKHEPGDGEAASDEIHTLDDGGCAQALGSDVCVRKVRDQESETSEGVVGEGDPGDDSPCVACGEELRVEDVWAEREDERGENGERVTSMLDRHGLCKSGKPSEFADSSSSACECLADQSRAETVCGTHDGLC